jgi:hypothetical protein
LKRFDPGDQAELVEAAPNGLEGHGYRRPFIRHRGWIQGYRGSRCSHILFHGVAPLRGFDTPSLSAQGEQRSSLICNIDRDILGGITIATFPVDEALARAIKSQPDPQLVLFF